MKVKASPNFNKYRCIVLGLEKKEFRELGKGDIVDIAKAKVDAHPEAFIEAKGVKDGSTQSL